MKKFFIKFLLANFFITMIFSPLFMFFGNIDIVNAGTPPQINQEILKQTSDNLINLKVAGTTLQSTSIVNSMIPKLFRLMFFLGTSLSVLAVIYGGYLMITSLGESTQQEKGWKVFGMAIVGIVLMLMSRAIVGIVSSLKIVKDSEASGANFALGDSSYIGNLPSGKIEADVIPQFIQLGLEFVVIVITGILIYAGIIYIASKDDEAKKKMTDLMLNALIGLILILISYALISGILKINLG